MCFTEIFWIFQGYHVLAKEGTITLEKAQATLKTKELIKSKDLRTDENGEGLSGLRGNGGSRGNRERVVTS